MLRRLIAPRWIAFALTVIVLAGVCVQLGRWQLHRLDSRHDRNQVTTTNLAAAAAPLDAVLGAGRRVGPELEWRQVTVTGRYDVAQQVVIRYRNVRKRPGFEVVTPLVLADGSAVLVNRGFLPRATRSSAVPDVPAPPAGQVTVTGRLRHSERGESSATTPVDRQARLINAPAIAASTGLTLVDGYLTADEQVPAPTTGLAALPLPEIDGGPHFFYALQWFFFALLAVGGLVYFAREDIRSARRGSGTDDPDPATADEPPGAAAAAGTADLGLRADRGRADGGAGLD